MTRRADDPATVSRPYAEDVPTVSPRTRSVLAGLTGGLVCAVSAGWLAVTWIGLGLGACGEDGELRGRAYERVCGPGLNLASVSGWAALAITTVAAVALSWSITRRDARPLVAAGVCAAAVATTLTAFTATLV
jgi:hypothetical protein